MGLSQAEGTVRAGPAGSEGPAGAVLCHLEMKIGREVASGSKPLAFVTRPTHGLQFRRQLLSGLLLVQRREKTLQPGSAQGELRSSWYQRQQQAGLWLVGGRTEAAARDRKDLGGD